jgi:hypothetical protein
MVIILQPAPTVITAIIPTPVRPMATMVRRGLTAASSLARDRGSAVASDSAVASMDGPFTGGLGLDTVGQATVMDGRASVAASVERAQFEADLLAVASTVMQSAAASTVAAVDSTAAVVVEDSTVVADTGKRSFIDSMKAAAGFYRSRFVLPETRTDR